MTSFSKYGRDVLETSHKRHFYKRYIWDVIKTLKIFEIYLRGLWDVSLKKEVFDTHLSKNKPSTTHPREYMGYIWEYINIWEKVFMNGPSKIFWRLSYTSLTWFILEYIDTYGSTTFLLVALSSEFIKADKRNAISFATLRFIYISITISNFIVKIYFLIVFFSETFFLLS